jgi:hypothetical protein
VQVVTAVKRITEKEEEEEKVHVQDIIDTQLGINTTEILQNITAALQTGN